MTCVLLSLKYNFFLLFHMILTKFQKKSCPKLIPAVCQERWRRMYPLPVSDGVIKLSLCSAVWWHPWLSVHPLEKCVSPVLLRHVKNWLPSQRADTCVSISRSWTVLFYWENCQRTSLLTFFFSIKQQEKSNPKKELGPDLVRCLIQDESQELLRFLKAWVRALTSLNLPWFVP